MPINSRDEELDEHVYIIGQLTAKLEAFGFGKIAIGQLRRVDFNVSRLTGEFQANHKALLSQRAIDETLHRLHSTVKTIRRFEKNDRVR